MKKNINNKVSRNFVQYLFIMFAIFPVSCKKYLDAKTNKTLVIPSTLNDAKTLLDFYSLMNEDYPSLGNESDDNYYLLDSYFNSRNINTQNNYTWAKEAIDELDWNNMYRIVLSSNVAIETVNLQSDSVRKSAKAKTIIGAAYFFRSLGFYNVVQYYAMPYDLATAKTLPGIPIRLSSDASQVTKRATLEESWQQIINGLKMAISLLPETNISLTRPSKTAAFAELANVYLDMSDFKSAEKYADSALLLNNTLIDYNLIDKTQLYPFTRYNAEVTFQAASTYPGTLIYTHYILDSLLYQSYDINDLRQQLYFKSNGPGTVGFRGSYDGTSEPFNGIANDEVYLIKAECAARNGKVDIAMDFLNRLLVTSWS
jgi:starch-binding outer membrane protein, SusD/RagB family